MSAEIIFHNPNDVNPGIAELEELGFECKILDLLDDCSNCVWVLARTVSDLDQHRFFDWVSEVVQPNGDLLEAGFTDP
jgi:hypothetical protein